MSREVEESIVLPSDPDESEGTLLGPDVRPDRPGWLGRLARLEPQLAFAIIPPRIHEEWVRNEPTGQLGKVIRPDLIGWGEPSCGWGWEVINLEGTWEDGAANTAVQAQLTGIVEADLWIRKVVYTVRRPNAFAGNILKAQSDYYNKLNPNISVELQIKSLCRYLIAPDATPLENIENVFECVCPIGFVLGCSSQIVARFVNLRAFGDGTGATNANPQNGVNEIPTEAVISFHGTRLPTRYDSCSIDRAVKALRHYGILEGAPVYTLPAAAE